MASGRGCIELQLRADQRTAKRPPFIVYYGGNAGTGSAFGEAAVAGGLSGLMFGVAAPGADGTCTLTTEQPLPQNFGGLYRSAKAWETAYPLSTPHCQGKVRRRY